MINGGRIFAKQLKNEGVEQIFTICGGQIMPIIYGCRAEGIKVIDVRHENAGVYAADAYARMTGKPGVMIATVTPGVMQTMQGIAEARGACSPVILISSSIATDDFDSGAEQDFDTYSVVKSNVIWSAKVMSVKRIPEYVTKAFRYALSPTPGPVYLECPVNVIKACAEVEKIDFSCFGRVETRPFGDLEKIDEAAKLLCSAENPVMIVGDASIFSADGDSAIEELANYLQMPVYATTMARGVFGSEENHLFRIGEGALQAADVILMFSATMNFRLNLGKPPMINKSAKIIQVHPDITKIGFNAPAHVGIVAGASAAARQLLTKLKSLTEPVKNTVWVKEAEKLHMEYRKKWDEGYNFKDINPMHPARCAAEVGKFLASEGKEWSVAIDGGDAYEWMMRTVTVTRPGQIVGYASNGTIGTGQGFAMGAWCARKKPVLLYTGDGSLGFYAMEFDTMARHGMQIICVVSNDSQWSMVKLAEGMRNEEETKKGFIATTLAKTRHYEEMVKALGCYGEYVTECNEIVPAIKRAYDSGLPALINVVVNDSYPCPFTVAYGCG